MITIQNGNVTFQNSNTIINPNVVTNGLIYYLDAENVNCYNGAIDTTGTTYNNLVGLPSGSLVGNTTFKTEPKRFDTNNSVATDIGYLSVTSAITFADASEYTFDTWVRIEDNGTGTTSNSIVGRGATAPWFYVSVSSNVNWRFIFRESDGTARLFAAYTTPTLVNNWNNATIVVTSDRVIKLYVNGVYKSSVTPTSSLFNISRIAGGYKSGTNTNPFFGSMAQFKIYNRALTDAEVLQNYNTIKTRYQ
jgi:hypothetical protein